MDASYSYDQRKGVRPVSWNDFHSICKGLAAAVYSFDPQLILAVARGGIYAGTLLSHILRKDTYPIKLTRRVNDIVQHDHPVWILRPPESVRGQRVLIVDEICDSGETLLMAQAEVMKLGASESRLAVLYAHRRGQDVPDYIGIVSDELLINPWDREIYQDGKFILHPEYAGALNIQGIEPGDWCLSGVDAFPIEKGRHE